MAEPNKAYPEGDPHHHTAKIKGMLDEPKAQALFETSAQVLAGLKTAFEHYESGSEAVMSEPKS